MPRAPGLLQPRGPRWAACARRGGSQSSQLIDTIVIDVDARRKDHHKTLRLDRRVEFHWSKETRQYDAQELSVFPWPIRYRVTTADAWYNGPDGQRAHYSPEIVGLDARAGVADVVKRTAVLLVVIGSIGYRRVAWLLQEVFKVATSKSTLSRWVKEVAAGLPSGEEIVKLLDAQKPITEAHFDEIFPKGAKGPVLVVKDEHGRIVASERIEARDETNVRKFLEWFKSLGLGVKYVRIPGCARIFRSAARSDVASPAGVEARGARVRRRCELRQGAGLCCHSIA